MDNYTKDQIIQRLDTIIYQLNQLTEALTEEEVNEDDTRNTQDNRQAKQ